MKFKTGTLLAILIFAASATHAEKPAPKPASSLGEIEGSAIGYASVAEALTAVKRDPAAREMFSGDGTVIQIGKIGQPNYALWTFVSPSHSAYPSAVKRVFVERSGQIVIDMDVKCEAAKPKCDQLVREFMTLNDRMVKAFNTPPKP